jgi:nucleoside-diphosphate-sugar epimerase
MRLLITGAAGYVGRRVSRGLEVEHDLRLGDLAVLEGDSRWVRLDVTRPADVEAAMRGVEAVIHLAVASGHEGDYEDDAFNQLRFDVNVRGTCNVLEAARRAGVPRFVHTSSLMVVWGRLPPEWVASDALPHPVGTYAVTKQIAETLCEYYARSFGLSVLCLRIPKPIDPDDPAWRGRRIRPQWLAFPDLIQAYRLALAAPDIGFEVVTVVGESSRRRWDLSKAERVLGYRPTLRLEELGFELGDEREPF